MHGGGKQRGGMALWFVGVDFLSGTVGLQVDVFSYSQLLFLCRFCIFVTSIDLKSRNKS